MTAIAEMTLRETATEIRRLADLANDNEREWSGEDETRWSEAMAHFDRSKVKAEARNLGIGRENAISDDASDEVRQAMGFPLKSGLDVFEQYRDVRSGSSVPVVRSDQCLTDALGTSHGSLGNEERFDGLSVGGVLRALAMGAESDVERRALSEGTDTAGGYTVPTVLSSRMIDLMRKKSRVIQAGAATIPVDSDRHEFAKLISDPTPGWRNEAAPVAESDPTFGRVVFQPRSLAVHVIVSEELLQDSVNIESALQNALSNALALEVDRAALFGSGTAPQPLGLFNMAGINTVSMGTNGAAITDYAPVLDAVEDLQEANAGEVSAAIMAPRTLRTFNGLTDTTGQPLRRPQSLDGLPMLETTQVPTDQTQGTADNASSILLGDFSGLVLGFRQRLRIEVLRELHRGNLQVGFIAHLRMDVQAWHEESFARITGVIPA